MLMFEGVQHLYPRGCDLRSQKPEKEYYTNEDWRTFSYPSTKFRPVKNAQAIA
jgi:hypothetical protein